MIAAAGACLHGSYRVHRILVAALAAVLGLGAVVTSAVLWHRPASDDPTTPVTVASPDAGATAAAPPPSPAPTVLEPVPASADPVGFAVDAVTALFAWDTSAPIARDAYVQRIVTVGDPAGLETPGLVADLTAYLPTDAAWAQLARYSTRQWLTVTGAVVPEQWAHVLASTPEGALAPGTTAVTIDGVRHRAGLWEGREVTDRFDVAFTVWVVCPPTYPACHLLRVGRLDTPMR
ncbi:hypothetical protein [Xylanimonas protaetiae]|uniref:Uncharacterized protein n=1 Tax=Xylanimonas protaetiae TaxID=2509457 RepID=A0A4P6F104_9MICO|nr:hypothetical protein [Xylanimonas protaetiae]QAY68775.1 hypothetical protein ET471_00860 [Xylanimonas protaetiae]